MKSRLDFQAVYTKGRSVANRAAVLYVLPQKPVGPARVGFAAGKKLGKAVVRNRVKRRVKAAVQKLWSRVRSGVLLVVVARQASKDMVFSELEAKVHELFERAGVLRTEGQEP